MIQRAPCDVCVLVKGEHTPKRVSFCGLCGAWLCEECQKRYDLRAIAMIKDKAAKLLAALKGQPLAQVGD